MTSQVRPLTTPAPSRPAPSRPAPSLPAPAGSLPLAGRAAEVVARPVLELVVPVFDEVVGLEASIRRLDTFVGTQLPFPVRLTIADNASTDGTWALACRLATELPRVRAVHLDAKGRGRALRAVWSTSEADIVAYTDVDLSTDLNALLPLVAPLLSGHSDVAIGSRLARGSRIVRGPKREVISRCYNRLLRTTMHTRFSDAQCGFKALRREVARQLLPLVEDEEWFFDTELLVLAEQAGLRIHEVPVDWVDDPDSRVDIVATAVADLRGMVRVSRGVATGVLRRQLPPSARPQLPSGMGQQLLRFGGIGLLSTFAYLALYAGLRPELGPFGANALALLITALANTAANRRVTFRVSGSRGRAADHCAGLGIFALGLLLTSGALATLSTLLRFVALRAWLTRPAARAS